MLHVCFVWQPHEAKPQVSADVCCSLCGRNQVLVRFVLSCFHTTLAVWCDAFLTGSDMQCRTPCALWSRDSFWRNTWIKIPLQCSKGIHTSSACEREALACIERFCFVNFKSTCTHFQCCFVVMVFTLNNSCVKETETSLKIMLTRLVNNARTINVAARNSNSGREMEPSVPPVSASPHCHAVVGSLEPLKMICSPLYRQRRGRFFQFNRETTAAPRCHPHFRRVKGPVCDIQRDLLTWNGTKYLHF